MDEKPVPESAPASHVPYAAASTEPEAQSGSGTAFEAPSQPKYYNYDGKPASRPAPMIAQSGLDCDDHGWVKAPIPLEEPLTDETLLEHERKKEEVLAAHCADTREIELNMDPLAPKAFSHIPIKGYMSQETFDELEYPKPPEYMTEDWMKKQIELERVDPRVNPNLLLDETQQEFWHTAARKPYAKQILRAEQHWTDRRNVWLKQYETVEIMNQTREEIGEKLEDCSMEAKRLVAPILHHKIVELALKNYLREANEYKIPFREVLDQPVNMKQLRGMRQQIDHGGDEQAARMVEQYTATTHQCLRDKLKKKEEEGKRMVTDHDMLSKQMNMGEKCKKDGYIEWHKGNYEEALASWRQADAHLKNHKAHDEDRHANKLIGDLHTAILKNIAQAAIKLGNWTEALDAAERALRVNDQDPKALFRKACALEGLGRYEEEAAALDAIDEVAVGRVDRDRIAKDVEVKREKIRWLYDRDSERQKRGVTRALARGVFSSDREQALPAPEEASKAPRMKAGDVVYVRHAFADFVRGQRGVCLEIDEDGDGRIQFDESDEVDLLMGEDLENLVAGVPPSDEDDEPEEPPVVADTAAEVQARKHLTKESILELLDAFERSYDDTMFQKQVYKLSRDVRRDKNEFMTNVRKVALEVQKPVLEKWGFEPTHRGVEEVQLAVRDTVMTLAAQGPEYVVAIVEKADAVGRLLHGDMYDIVTSGPREGRAPPFAVAL